MSHFNVHAKNID